MTERLMLADPPTGRISTTRNQRLLSQLQARPSNLTVHRDVTRTSQSNHLLAARSGAKESEVPHYKSAQNITRMSSSDFNVLKAHWI
jgi:hypothetical protein